MLSFLRRRRRKKVLSEPFPSAWLPIIDRHLLFYSAFDDEFQTAFRDELQVFLNRVEFFGAAELEITDEMRVVIGGSAVRLILGLDDTFYLRLKEIVVYPHDYRHPDRDDDARILGEAHHFGTVVLSWPAVLAGISRPEDGHNTAVHEFAHVLDKTSLGFDGTPRLRERADYAVWGEVLTHHYDRLREGESPEVDILRMYGATNEAEFFAVATEAFFERPDDMQELAPELFQELARFYGYEP